MRMELAHERGNGAQNGRVALAARPDEAAPGRSASSEYADLSIGVLAVQGAFIEHIQAFEKLGARAREVRLAADLESLDGLVLPGGESTAIGKLLVDF
jgi:hypothetical protein